MTPPHDLLAERDARAVVLAAARRVDAQDWRAFAELFTADARLTRPDGTVLEGRSAIEAAYAGRDPARRTRHVISNHEITWTGQGASGLQEAHSLCLVLVWSAHQGPGQGVTPQGLAADAMQQLGEFEDRLVRTEGGWKIQTRQARFVMHHP